MTRDNLHEPVPHDEPPLEEGPLETDLAVALHLSMRRAEGRDPHTALAATRDRIATRIADRSRAQSSRHRPWLIATTALAAAVTGLLVVAITGPDRAAISTFQDVTYEAQRAEKVSLRLPDGTRLVLAPESHITFHETQTGSRHLSTQGQVHIQVTHDPGRPFTVQTRDVTTEVLGTAFMIRAYPADPAVNVVVEDGKVAVHKTAARTNGDPVTLLAGMGIAVGDSGTIIERDLDVPRQAQWTAGRLDFEDAPVTEMLETVGRWYGYRFLLADSALARRHVTAMFVTNNPTETLQTIRTVLGVSMSVGENGVITLRRTTPRRDNIGRERKSPFLRSGMGVGI